VKVLSEDRLKGMVIQARNSYVSAKKQNNTEEAMEKLEEIGRMLTRADGDDYKTIVKYLTD
jgi:hypothetical protein